MALPGNKVKASSKNAFGPVGEPWSEAGGDGLSAVDPRPSPSPMDIGGLPWLPEVESIPSDMDSSLGDIGPGLELVFEFVSSPKPMESI